jgi:hypothetical protein
MAPDIAWPIVSKPTRVARVDGGDGVVVDAHFLQGLVGQVGDHHVGLG